MYKEEEDTSAHFEYRRENCPFGEGEKLMMETALYLPFSLNSVFLSWCRLCCPCLLWIFIGSLKNGFWGRWPLNFSFV